MERIKLHKDFRLNGVAYSSIKNILSSKQDMPIDVYEFLEDWFSREYFINVNTSGSTGKPKTIKLQKQHMINSALATGKYFNLTANTSALLCLPVTYIAGKMMLVRALVLGWHIDVIQPNLTPLSTTEKQYDFAAMIPLQIENSLSKIHLIKKVIVGGGVVSKKLHTKLQGIKSLVFATYGMTETITHIAVKQLNKISYTPNFYNILPNVTVFKDDRGCLVIKANKVSNDVIFTNDVVSLISNTEFEWLGRFDNVINSGGVKLHPEKIEAKLVTVIKQRFFVAGIADERLGERLILLVEVKEEVNIVALKNEIDRNVKRLQLLSKFEIPKEIYFLKEFTETKTGKIQRIETLKKIKNSINKG